MLIAAVSSAAPLVAAALLALAAAWAFVCRLRYPPGCQVEFRRRGGAGTGQVLGFRGVHVRVVNVSTGNEHRVLPSRLKRR